MVVTVWPWRRIAEGRIIVGAPSQSSRKTLIMNEPAVLVADGVAHRGQVKRKADLEADEGNRCCQCRALP